MPEESVTDWAAERAARCAELLRHADPVLRELGERLGGGLVAPRDVPRVPEYRAALDGALRLLRTAGMAAVADALRDGPGAGAAHRAGDADGTATGGSAR